MLRSLFGQVLSLAILVGILAGWWFAAGQDVGTMLTQLLSLVTWLGKVFKPLWVGLFKQTAS